MCRPIRRHLDGGADDRHHHEPEIGEHLDVAGISTNYHDHDHGHSNDAQPPVLLLHGSGPGVSAWTNWRTALPGLSADLRVLAPDIVGFGYTDRPRALQLHPRKLQAALNSRVVIDQAKGVVTQRAQLRMTKPSPTRRNNLRLSDVARHVGLANSTRTHSDPSDLITAENS